MDNESQSTFFPFVWLLSVYSPDKSLPLISNKAISLILNLFAITPGRTALNPQCGGKCVAKREGILGPIVQKQTSAGQNFRRMVNFSISTGRFCHLGNRKRSPSFSSKANNYVLRIHKTRQTLTAPAAPASTVASNIRGTYTKTFEQRLLLQGKGFWGLRVLLLPRSSSPVTFK
jgi:hypothetical protein